MIVKKHLLRRSLRKTSPWGCPKNHIIEFKLCVFHDDIETLKKSIIETYKVASEPLGTIWESYFKISLGVGNSTFGLYLKWIDFELR